MLALLYIACVKCTEPMLLSHAGAILKTPHKVAVDRFLTVNVIVMTGFP